MEKTRDQQSRTESKTRLVEQINACLRAGDYSRALDLLRSASAEFPNDAELSELEKLAQDGVKRNAEAQRLITESQELFAQQKSVEAIQLLRKAYDLDKHNSLARAILANALVEHAQSMVETDWLEAERLTNQALNLNPAHPTAKTILSLIVARKEASSVEDWVSQARKLQSAGDLFAALAWVAEGLAVHPHDPKLLQIQDEIQRDQDARRRQARRGDLDDLRRLQREIDGATDLAAKQALAARIQALAAKHWTDGEILSIANALLLRLGLVSQASATESSGSSPRAKGATVILHVPRPTAPEASRVATSQVSPTPIPVPPSPIPPQRLSAAATVPPSKTQPGKAQPSKVAPIEAPASQVQPSTVQQATVATAPPPAVTAAAAEPSGSADKVRTPPSRPKQPARSNSTTLILVSAAAIILAAVIFFFARKHPAAPVAQIPSAQTPSAAPSNSARADSAPVVPAPAVSAPTATAAAPATPEPSPPALPVSSDTATGKLTPPDQTQDDQPRDDQTRDDQPRAAEPPVGSARNLGTLLVVAGQDGAKVFLNGKLQPRLTQAGQLRLPNLEPKDYVVQISKTGFQDPAQQKIRIRKGEPATLVFHLQPHILQPQPRLASLTIQGGAPGTSVFIDQSLVGTIQPNGTLSVSTVNPGDHTVELRKERFRPRQFKKHFVESGTISLAATDAALEAAPAELKITYTPADATVAIAKDAFLKIVSSGVPLNLVPGSYTLTARTADGFTRSSPLEVIPGQSRTLALSLAPNGMSKWDDPGAWKHEKDSFTRRGGNFVLYGVVPASGTFVFSAMLTKGRLLQWVVNYTDPKNYVLFQIDDHDFYRTVIRNGEKTDQIIVPDPGDRKSFRTLHIRVSPTEIVHQIRHGDSWTVLDRWTQPGTNLSLGKFGFYLPGDDQLALSTFAHYAVNW
ncbi:MAG TPA: hypothetical protein VMD99_12275 [Terriglobales bacterium]|nr:hypothetical protein [Terriglobales bacterium]